MEKDDTMEAKYQPLQYGLVDTIVKFNGEDMTYSSSKWSQDIEDNAEIFGWSAQQKLIIARRSLTGTAELWLRTEKPFRSYEELRNALLKEFPDSVNTKQMHEIMAARKKRNNESYYQYMLTMKELGKRAKFADYVSIQYIIDGITDYEQNKIGLYGITTYAVLKEKLAQYEAMKQKMLKRGNSSGTAGKQRECRESTKQAKADDTNVKENASEKVYRCFKCGERGHSASSCKKGTKCFKCNQFGHIGTQCQDDTSNGASGKGEPSTSRNDGGKSGGGANSKARSMFAQYQSLDDGTTNERDSKLMSNENIIQQCQSCQCQNNNLNNSVLSVNKNNKNTVNKSVKSIIIGGITVKCLIDTGSDLNLISYDLFTMLSVKCESQTMLLTGLGSSKVYSLGKFNIQLIIDSHCYEVCFHVVPTGVIPYAVILGQTFLVNTMVMINNGIIEIRPQCYDSSYLQCLLSSYTNESEIPEVQSIIDNYKPLKIKEAPIKLKIVLKDDIPVVQRPRRLALQEEEIVKHQIEDWLAKGIIRPSYSEYASPLVLVKKKDGSTRICVDYRKINQRMVKDEYPLPVINDHIDKLCTARVFSTLDLKNGFFHLPVDEDSIKYTAFVTSNPEGQFEFLRAPFGLSICPKFFTRYINIIFTDFVRRGVLLIFIDDLIILAEDEHQAIQRLQEVLKVAADYGLEINWKKSQLLQRSVEYLGHVICKGTVQPSKEKTEAVQKFPVPKNLKEVQSFIGLTSYFRKFVPNYAMVARPLSDLLKKKEFYFEEDQRNAFLKLKQLLGCEPVLKIYDPQLKTELHTDACKYGYAAVLMQKDPADGGMHPVHYMSRKTDETQQKWCSYELEALAVIEGVKKFRRYLIGIPFVIITDCQAFQKTLTKRDVSAKVARWIMYLQDFNYTIMHRPGEKMQHVDALSRNICIIQTELHFRIQKAQEDDEGLKAIKEVLKENNYEDYVLQNDVIYKGEDKKLVVPELMDLEIIRRAHSIGHFGKKKVRDIIEQDYYIAKLDDKIEKVISACVPCLLANRNTGKKEGFLNPIPKGDLPLDTLHCDHLGPLDATKKMYNYILTVIDGYTKFVWIYPVKTVTAKETVDKLKLHQKDYGNPRRIVTDRGTAFTAKEFEDYCQEEEIEHITITTGIPRGNGQAERMNRIIISVLTKMCIEEPALWYKHISKLQRVINSSYQRSIQTSPFELLTGTKIRLKDDMKILEYLEEQNRREFMDKRDELRKEAKAQILKIQEENRRNFNSKRKEGQKYKTGDIIAIQRTQFGNALKLKQKFFGPYKVVKELGKDRYEVRKLDNSKEGPKHTTTAVDFMKRWP